MGKRKSGYVWTDKKTGYIYARVQVKGSNGKPRSIYKRALNVTNAEELGKDMLAEHADRGAAYLDSLTTTFLQFAEWYKTEFVVAPVYVDEKKVDGMRTWEAERKKIDRITEEIGHHLIGDVDESVLRKYRRKRLKTVGIAAANRDFETIRAMLRKAKQKKLIKAMPEFAEFIDKSLENRRTVTITEAEEARILAKARAFTGSPRLYALIIALRDSGARPNELYPVNDYTDTKTKYEPIRWRDIIHDGQILPVTRLVSYKGKRREVRLGVVTDRMAEAFRDLWQHLKRSKNLTPERTADLDNLIFPHTTYKNAWQQVRTKAGVPDLRLRDLRRDWVSRLARLGYSDKLAQRGAGHKKMQTSFEYTEFDLQAAMQAKDVLDADNASREPIQTNDTVQ